MHFTKLFLTASFAAAAAMRGGVTILADSQGFVQLPAALIGTTGIAVETVASLVVGSVLAITLNRPRARKTIRK